MAQCSLSHAKLHCEHINNQNENEYKNDLNVQRTFLEEKRSHFTQNSVDVYVNNILLLPSALVGRKYQPRHNGEFLWQT